MVDILDPNALPDTAAESLRKDLGQQAQIEGQLVEMQQQLEQLPESASAMQRAALKLEIGRSLQVLERGDEAWPITYTALGILLTEQQWEAAADACNVLYESNQPDSLIALGHGIWLGVTFPIDPEISVNLLSHVVDDTPDDSDGAAVAAATACFIADVRASEGPDKERLTFFSQQLLGRVARLNSWDTVQNPRWTVEEVFNTLSWRGAPFAVVAVFVAMVVTTTVLRVLVDASWRATRSVTTRLRPA